MSILQLVVNVVVILVVTFLIAMFIPAASTIMNYSAVILIILNIIRFFRAKK